MQAAGTPKPLRGFGAPAVSVMCARCGTQKGFRLRHIGVLKPDYYVDLLNWLGIPIAFGYIASMFVYPWIDGNWNWAHVQEVWDRWQSLNVGMLAFISSIAAFNISRFNAKKQRERDFLAAKSFLPATLSQLCTYFEECASFLCQAWSANNSDEQNFEAPDLPNDYREIFSTCIRFADPDVGDYLSKIIVWLQINDTRLRGAFSGARDGHIDVSPRRHNIITYLYRLGELQARVNQLFPFARGMEDFNGSTLVWDNFSNAYGLLNIEVQEFHINDNMNLESFTRRAIERG